MNTRHIVTTKSWFGGSADLNPIRPLAADTRDFHAALKAACDAHGADYYDRFSKWCDEYFWLPHRNEARGVGGIFYDYLDSGDWDADLAFTQAVGRSFAEIYPAIVRRHMDRDWTAEERDYQRFRRGRYVEFNLLYDRGTRFGLQTGGNTEAILMSLPPMSSGRDAPAAAGHRRHMKGRHPMTSTLRTGRLAPILLLLALVVGAAPAQATSAKIQAFFGKWEGNAVSESRISVNFQLTVRDINVEVGPSGGGFLLTWRTVQRQKGSPSDPKEVLRETTLDFQPVRAGIWRAGDSAIPWSTKAPMPGPSSTTRPWS